MILQLGNVIASKSANSREQDSPVLEHEKDDFDSRKESQKGNDLLKDNELEKLSPSRGLQDEETFIQVDQELLNCFLP